MYNGEKSGGTEMDEHTISPYQTDKVKLGVRVALHQKLKLKSMAQMWGVSANALVGMMIDEMYYEPLSPTLTKTVKNGSDRVGSFFRKTRPHWVSDRSPQ